MSLSGLSIAVIFVALLATSRNQVSSSGVFELEVLKLQQLDLKTTNEINSTKTDAQHQVKENQSDLIRILVCLKEAFTSQLDGPCTFGNASITLSDDSIRHSRAEDLAEADRSQQQQSGQSQNAQNQGSQLTNIVRILFTFRWTVSSFHLRNLVESKMLFVNKRASRDKTSQHERNCFAANAENVPPSFKTSVLVAVIIVAVVFIGSLIHIRSCHLSTSSQFASAIRRGNCIK